MTTPTRCGRQEASSPTDQMDLRFGFGTQSRAEAQPVKSDANHLLLIHRDKGDKFREMDVNYEEDFCELM
jgi:hypothetical protein